jgi:hypothetical protein
MYNNELTTNNTGNLSHEEEKKMTSEEYRYKLIRNGDDRKCRLLSLPRVTEREHKLIQARLMMPPGENCQWLVCDRSASKCYYGWNPTPYELNFPALPNNDDVPQQKRDFTGYSITMSYDEQHRIKRVQKEFLRIQERESNEKRQEETNRMHQAGELGESK